jgi:hypothetical protein
MEANEVMNKLWAVFILVFIGYGWNAWISATINKLTERIENLEKQR